MTGIPKHIRARVRELDIMKIWAWNTTFMNSVTLEELFRISLNLNFLISKTGKSLSFSACVYTQHLFSSSQANMEIGLTTKDGKFYLGSGFRISTEFTWTILCSIRWKLLHCKYANYLSIVIYLYYLYVHIFIRFSKQFHLSYFYLQKCLAFMTSKKLIICIIGIKWYFLEACHKNRDTKQVDYFLGQGREPPN